MISTRRAQVTELEMVTHDIRRVRFVFSEPLEYLPGAFVSFTLPVGAEPISRTYSIATPPSSTCAIEINVKLVPGGAGSGYIHNVLKEGDEIEFCGPFSGYPASLAPESLICIGGGSGISPIMSILRHLSEIQSERNILFFYGAATAADVPYLAELRGLEKTMKSFRFIPSTSKGDGGEGFETGRPTDVAKRFCPDASHCSSYVCGRPAMIESACKVLGKWALRTPPVSFSTASTDFS